MRCAYIAAQVPRVPCRDNSARHLHLIGSGGEACCIPCLMETIVRPTTALEAACSMLRELVRLCYQEPAILDEANLCLSTWCSTLVDGAQATHAGHSEFSQLVRDLLQQLIVLDPERTMAAFALALNQHPSNRTVPQCTVLLTLSDCLSAAPSCDSAAALSVATGRELSERIAQWTLHTARNCRPTSGDDDSPASLENTSLLSLLLFICLQLLQLGAFASDTNGVEGTNGLVGPEMANAMLSLGVASAHAAKHYHMLPCDVTVNALALVRAIVASVAGPYVSPPLPPHHEEQLHWLRQQSAASSHNSTQDDVGASWRQHHSGPYEGVIDDAREQMSEALLPLLLSTASPVCAAVASIQLMLLRHMYSAAHLLSNRSSATPSSFLHRLMDYVCEGLRVCTSDTCVPLFSLASTCFDVMSVWCPEDFDSGLVGTVGLSLLDLSERDPSTFVDAISASQLFLHALSRSDVNAVALRICGIAKQASGGPSTLVHLIATLGAHPNHRQLTNESIALIALNMRLHCLDVLEGSADGDGRVFDAMSQRQMAATIECLLWISALTPAMNDWCIQAYAYLRRATSTVPAGTLPGFSADQRVFQPTSSLVPLLLRLSQHVSETDEARTAFFREKRHTATSANRLLVDLMEFATQLIGAYGLEHADTALALLERLAGIAVPSSILALPPRQRPWGIAALCEALLCAPPPSHQQGILLLQQLCVLAQHEGPFSPPESSLGIRTPPLHLLPPFECVQQAFQTLLSATGCDDVSDWERDAAAGDAVLGLLFATYRGYHGLTLCGKTNTECTSFGRPAGKCVPSLKACRTLAEMLPPSSTTTTTHPYDGLIDFLSYLLRSVCRSDVPVDLVGGFCVHALWIAGHEAMFLSDFARVLCQDGSGGIGMAVHAFFAPWLPFDTRGAAGRSVGDAALVVLVRCQELAPDIVCPLFAETYGAKLLMGSDRHAVSDIDRVDNIARLLLVVLCHPPCAPLTAEGLIARWCLEALRCNAAVWQHRPTCLPARVLCATITRTKSDEVAARALQCFMQAPEHWSFPSIDVLLLALAVHKCLNNKESSHLVRTIRVDTVLSTCVLCDGQMVASASDNEKIAGVFLSYFPHFAASTDAPLRDVTLLAWLCFAVESFVQASIASVTPDLNAVTLALCARVLALDPHHLVHSPSTLALVSFIVRHRQRAAAVAVPCSRYALRAATEILDAVTAYAPRWGETDFGRHATSQLAAFCDLAASSHHHHTKELPPPSFIPLACGPPCDFYISMET